MLLEISDLSKKYVRDEKEYLVLDKVNFQAEKGQLITIIGQSGSGKSTFFNIVTGMLEQSSGSIKIDEIEVSGKRKEFSEIRNQKVGYIMQGQNLLNNFSVLDNVCFPFYLTKKTRKLRGRKANTNCDCSKDSVDIKVKAEGLLREVGLYDARNAFPSQLSGGEIKRVAVVRALINSPDIIIADEPTGNLDPWNSQKIIELFREISETGVSVIVSTHDMEFLKYSNRSYEMKNGKLGDLIWEKNGNI